MWTYNYTYSYSDELYHFGTKGQKWGQRRYQNKDGSLTPEGKERYSKGGESKVLKKVKTGAKVAAVLLAAYGTHKILNDPNTAEIGKNFIGKLSNASGIVSNSVKSSAEYKIAGTAAKGIKKYGGKVLDVVGNEKVGRTIAGVGAMATTTAVLRTQIKELKNIKNQEGDAFDKSIDTVKRMSDIGANVNSLAKGPLKQTGGTFQSSSSNKASSNLLVKTRNLKSELGDPKGMRGADDEKVYQSFFKRNPSDEQRAVIKAMRKNGYGVDQIEQYVFNVPIKHSQRDNIYWSDTIMWNYNNTYSYPDELYHFGVKGMKWGVRRYQKFDGSLTRAGLKRYNKSLDRYEKANERYKNAKKGSSKTELTNSRLERKLAKRQLKKDYKHLKQDKMADKGKELYSKGHTITGHNDVSANLLKISGLAGSALAYNKMYKLIDDDNVNKGLEILSGAAVTAARLNQIMNYNKNRNLRAYYSHTSKY